MIRLMEHSGVLKAFALVLRLSRRRRRRTRASGGLFGSRQPVLRLLLKSRGEQAEMGVTGYAAKALFGFEKRESQPA